MTLAHVLVQSLTSGDIKAKQAVHVPGNPKTRSYGCLCDIKRIRDLTKAWPESCLQHGPLFGPHGVHHGHRLVIQGTVGVKVFEGLQPPWKKNSQRKNNHSFTKDFALQNQAMY